MAAQEVTRGPGFDAAFVQAFRAGTLTEAQAAAVVPHDHAATVFLLLQLSAAMAAPIAGSPHAPSSATPVFLKPATKGRRKKPGAQQGHTGKARPQPAVIDRHESHQLPACPCCGGELHRTGRKRTRIIEDIPPDLKPEAVEHTIHRDWCPKCKRQVEPKVPDALPNCQLGNRVVTLSAWLHYGLGTTTSQIVEVLNGHLKLPISAGGLTEIWHRLADVLTPWYEQIQRDCLEAAVLHADETGWRVAGKTWWLWCFTTPVTTCYVIDASRGHDALNEFFAEQFAGVLITDFWKAYDIVAETQQKCWAHLLRELKDIDAQPHANAHWHAFAKKLRRLFGDAVRLKAARDRLEDDTFERRMELLVKRLLELAEADWTHEDAQRLAKRLRDHADHMLTFVDQPDVPPTNNHAERQIRPAVLMRKASYGNASADGAATRAVLMSINRTLKQRGLDPLEVTTNALRAYAATGQLPPLPQKLPANTS